MSDTNSGFDCGNEGGVWGRLVAHLGGKHSLPRRTSSDDGASTPPTPGTPPREAARTSQCLMQSRSFEPLCARARSTAACLTCWLALNGEKRGQRLGNPPPPPLPAPPPHPPHIPVPPLHRHCAPLQSREALPGHPTDRLAWGWLQVRRHASFEVLSSRESESRPLALAAASGR